MIQHILLKRKNQDKPEHQVILVCCMVPIFFWLMSDINQMQHAVLEVQILWPCEDISIMKKKWEVMKMKLVVHIHGYDRGKHLLLSGCNHTCLLLQSPTKGFWLHWCVCGPDYEFLCFFYNWIFHGGEGGYFPQTKDYYFNFLLNLQDWIS